MRKRKLKTGAEVYVHLNNGLRKRCHHKRREWSHCADAWHLNFRWGGRSYRFPLRDSEGHPIADRATGSAEADRIRSEIRKGTYRTVLAEPPTTAAGLTLSEFADKYLKGYSREVRNKKTWPDDKSKIKQLCAFPLDSGPLGDQPIGLVTDDTLERFLLHLRAKGHAASTRNKYLQLLRSAAKWGEAKGYLTRRWLVGSELKREKGARRDRRLAPGEEAALINHANGRLQRLIIAALETGARLGELLALLWRDVSLDRGELRLRAETTKTATARTIPISPKLRAVLKMARLDPAGKEHRPDAFVFGNAIGQPLGSIRTSWENCLLLAHGHEVKRTKRHQLSPECRAQLRAINLTFHDLRHEAGSRFLEAGWPLHHVRGMLGHASVATTDNYLNSTRQGLSDSMTRYGTRSPLHNVAQEAEIEQRPTCNATQPDVAEAVIH